MSPEESQNFIKVLEGLWPKLIVCADDTEGWLKRLWRFDYEKARKCVQDYKFNRTRQGLPPTGVILGVMESAVIPREATGGEPVELYVILCPDGVDLAGKPKFKRTGFPVAGARGVPANAEAVQREAEELRKRLAGDREGFIVQWLCEAVAPSAPF